MIPEATQTFKTKVNDFQTRAAVGLVGLWRGVWPNRIVDSWNTILDDALPVFSKLQYEAASAGVAYAGETLAELGDYVAPKVWVDVEAFAGQTLESGELRGRLLTPAFQALEMIDQGVGAPEALRRASVQLGAMAQTMVADTARQAASVDIVARPHVGYVRMCGSHPCDRCLVLAGRRYEWNKGFLRHPRCSCVHVPATDKQLKGAKAEGLIADPYEYFHSLTPEEQARVFGKASAQAIRDGADLFQVVNAKRGRYGSHDIFTTEGTSRRGHAAKGLKRGQRRLTPDGIYRQAEQFHLTREQTLELLRTHGYIHEGGQNPLGSIRGQREGYGRYGHGGARARAREAVLEARRTGVRDPHNPYTMTAAEHRLWKAEQDWLNVQADINPYSSAGVEQRWGLPRTTPSYCVSDVEKVRAEKAYRSELARQGLRFGEHPVGPMLLGGPSRAGWGKPRKPKPKLARPEMIPRTGMGVVASRGKARGKQREKTRKNSQAGVDGTGILPLLAGAGGGGKKPPLPPESAGFEFPFDPYDSWMWRKILYGIEGADGLDKGGHLKDAVVNKRYTNTEFRADWSEMDIFYSMISTAMQVESGYCGGQTKVIYYYDPGGDRGDYLLLKYYKDQVSSAEETLDSIEFRPANEKERNEYRRRSRRR
ncbi:hypothetical protein ACRQEC_09115 [Actinotignum sp. GS-2025c]|uniref:hypothetical protein n=1 Tax=Actinotignum sp. GS-2025c TaxID=3427276 RepID=UPI003F47D523